MFFNKVNSVTSDELKKIVDEVNIIDVREPSEYAEGHIPTAINVPLGTIDAYVPKNKTYVICHSGMRSKQASKILLAKGCDVVNVKGGMVSWSGELKEGK